MEQKRSFNAEKKLEILREHLKNRVPISERKQKVQNSSNLNLQMGETVI